MICGCSHRLNNRQRALMHFVVAEGFLRPWARILLLGDVAALQPFLASAVDHAFHWVGSLDNIVSGVTPPRGGYHLILSVEQLTPNLIRADVFGALMKLLASGGTVAFTAPFDANSESVPEGDRGPINWCALPMLTKIGFSDARACLYWSEEFGYLGLSNIIIAASRC